MKIYLVGGAVRDQLLGLPVKERDWVVVGATAEQMRALGYTRVGKDFPVFLHPRTHEEYALARTERKTGPGYTGFEVHASPEVTLEQDLERRDLTINAMAEDEQGNLIDPFHGREDLDAGVLRHVSPAFVEDPVRILRVARFAARFGKWGFHVAHGTNALMRRMVANGEVDALVPERVWVETEKALSEEHPERFFQVLRGCGALARVFPEIDALFGVPQPERPHPEVDTGVHAMLVLQQAARLTPDPQVRFAALVHDLGKGTTPEEQWPRHLEHEKRGAELAKQMCQRLRAPNDYRDLALITARHHGRAHRAAEMTAGSLLKTLEQVDALRRPERFEQFLLACEADARGRKGHENDPYPQAEILRRALAACRSVDTGGLVARGLKGETFASELRRARIAAIEQVRAKTPSAQS
ncbi:MAG: multifunctional CCA addition/repair protein [Gammaproteobacteria bacterium]